MEIKTKENIVDEIKSSNQRAMEWFEAIPADHFFARTNEAWSASDNVDHLIKAVKQIVLALKMPKLGLQTMFGKADHASTSYAEICAAYEVEISKGGQASGRYLPDQESPDQPDEKKKDVLSKLDKTGNSLLSAVEKWQDAELDQYQLPHPILSNLTVRETLFFTIYHTLRHARIEGD